MTHRTILDKFATVSRQNLFPVHMLQFPVQKLPLKIIKIILHLYGKQGSLPFRFQPRNPKDPSAHSGNILSGAVFTDRFFVQMQEHTHIISDIRKAFYDQMIQMHHAVYRITDRGGITPSKPIRQEYLRLCRKHRDHRSAIDKGSRLLLLKLAMTYNDACDMRIITADLSGKKNCR